MLFLTSNSFVLQNSKSITPVPVPNLKTMYSSSSPFFISTETLCSILTHKTLIDHFESNLPKASNFLQTPIRHHYSVSPSSSLLLMPSWSSSPSYLPYIGVKLVTHFPQNSALNLPGVQGSYVLFSSTNGQTLASMDSTELTLYRTSCVSGLASKYLARDDSEVLVMVGAGAMAPHLIRAHLSARPSLRRVLIWNRTVEKARTLAQKLRESGEFEEGLRIEGCEDLDEVVGFGDIVSCATNSEAPLVKGEKLKLGAHLDLVGSFKPSMMECDDEAIRRGTVFVDNEAALVEAGELVGAFERGVIEKDEIGGDLLQLIRGDKIGRTNLEQITVFKSVGSAVVDTLAAQLVYETYIRG